MGTWGEGLYDNDSCLDDLGDLLSICGEERDIVELTTRIGLLAWMNSVSVSYAKETIAHGMREFAEDLDTLPPATRLALETLLADPDTATKVGSRKPEVHEVLGGYCDGPRIDALLRFPGAKPVIDAFAERMAKVVDTTLNGKKRDLYDVSRSLAPLGIILELCSAGFFQPSPNRVATWRLGFDVADKATKSEREFGSLYTRKIRKGFDLLAPEPGHFMQADTVERYQHPKLGIGMLVARSGKGAEEKLELRFEDGQIRKVLASFVTRMDN
jgi:hypothetical protein